MRTWIREELVNGIVGPFRSMVCAVGEEDASVVTFLCVRMEA